MACLKDCYTLHLRRADILGHSELSAAHLCDRSYDFWAVHCCLVGCAHCATVRTAHSLCSGSSEERKERRRPFSFPVHVGVPFLRLQWNSRPWYSVSAWIARRFARFFFDFFDFFVFLGLFPPSARCFLFPYPPGVIRGLGTILAMLN